MGVSSVNIVVCISRFDLFFFFKQKTAYEMRISDWSSDVCSSDLVAGGLDRPSGGRAAPSLLRGGRHRRRGRRSEREGRAGARRAADREIGRASCRESVCQYV